MVDQTKSQFYNASGEPVSLSDEIARGGEGRILNVDNHSDRVAKIYHHPIDHEKATKLSVMVSLKTDRLLGLTAWPVDTLHEFVGGPVSGFLMPRIKDHKDIHVLYGVKSRNAEYPEARWPFLIHVAANVARAFNVIHEHGHVIGDVNHASIVVSKRGTVRLVDCDSFQITTSEHQFLCEVGISTHLPPELQGKDLRGIVRTVDHDAFGMAVIIFQLLFMGRHPFSGTSLGPIDIPLEKAIREHRFAYGRDSAYRQMRQPPASLGLDAVSPQTALMFEQAFLLDAHRPTAESWISALTEMSTDLQKCASDNAHYFINSLQACPWCEIESHSGIVLFHGSSDDKPAGTFDMVKIWMDILRVPDPGYDSLLKESSIMTTSMMKQGGALVRRQRNTGFGAAIEMYLICAVFQAIPISYFHPLLSILFSGVFLGQALYFVMKTSDDTGNELYKLKILVEKQLAEARKLAKGNDSSDPFWRALRDLTAKKDQYEKLSDLRYQKIEQLQKVLQEHQLHDFLSAHRIEHAGLSGIDKDELIALESSGIDNAEHVSILSTHKVPGLKASHVSALEKWRRLLRDEFRDHPKANLSSADSAAIEAEISNAKIRLQKELRSGPAYLEQIRQHVLTSHEAGHPAVKDCQAAYLQAQAYLKECSPKFWIGLSVAIYAVSTLVFLVRFVLK